MRNEEIVKALIDKAKVSSDDQNRQIFIFALTKMTEQRTSLIPGRTCMGVKESEELYNRVVLPAIKELKGGAQLNQQGNQGAPSRDKILTTASGQASKWPYYAALIVAALTSGAIIWRLVSTKKRQT